MIWVPPSKAALSKKLYFLNQVARYLRRYHWEKRARRKDVNKLELIPTLRIPSSARIET